MLQHPSIQRVLTRSRLWTKPDSTGDRSIQHRA